MKGAVEVESNRHPNVKLPTLVIAASAVVSVGALAVAVGQEQTATVVGGGMSLGATTSTSVAPTTIPVAFAHPVVKASLPKGYR
jgi:hypothetical protein